MKSTDWFRGWRLLAVSLALMAVGLALGLYFTRGGIINWDDWEHIRQSRWLLSTYGLISADPNADPAAIVKWYGSLWENVMGFFGFIVLGFLRDVISVRHAITFALWPMTLWMTFAQLRRAGVGAATAALAASVLFGIIRLGGHALINIKDFPFAVCFLIVTIYLWNLFRETFSGDEARPGYARLAWIGVVSTWSYLLRPPVALHFVLAWAGVAFLVGGSRRESLRDKCLKILTVPLAAFTFIFVAYPPVRVYGIGQWLISSSMFAHYPWIGPVKVWGEVYRSDQLPWWYTFAWIPVIAHPFALVTAIGGAAALVKRRALGHAFLIRKRWNLSLKTWLGAVTLLAWLAVLVKNPVLYDEERHVLFLFPPLFLVAALGMDFMRDKWKWALSAGIAAGSLWSYAEWGRYAYVYKSALIGDTSAGRFMGDYWGLCVTPMMSDIEGRVPADADIVIIGPAGIGPVALDRFRESLIAKRAGFGQFHAKELNEAKRPAVLIALNRMLINGALVTQDINQAISAKAATKIGAQIMPPGDEACLAALFQK